MSSTELKEIIDIGNSFATGKYYSVATATIYFYDFILTLADEIKYAWQGKKSWVFVIFLVNRYFPMAYQLWITYVSYSTPFHQQLCERTAFFEILVAVETTLIAQVVVTLRIYAVTGKNRMITSCLGVIMISQFILGFALTVYTAKRGAQPVMPIPLRVYMICMVMDYKNLEMVFAVISPIYDLLAFSVIVYLVVRSNVNKVPIPSLLVTITRDATYYFLVIFTSHVVVVLFLRFASPAIRLLPASGNVVLLPVMVTRLMLSLKKAANPQEDGWSLGEPTMHMTMRFAERRGGVSTRDEVPLDTFASVPEGTQGQA